ncbi:hypothetical protein CEV31_3157 [Brucella thiophenivorans]|uniref:Uncharacterized protein n=1 Tax=Brucella thiophenivorans TaxID=571255 RepID=A0A256FIS4_9HYPH|nr:hypothetical protein CEV31_3157 [Brucella thiophenivorans]
MQINFKSALWDKIVGRVDLDQIHPFSGRSLVVMKLEIVKT